MYKDPETHRYQVIGVTSFGTKTCDSSVPGIYTRVTEYLHWIEETMLKDFED